MAGRVVGAATDVVVAIVVNEATLGLSLDAASQMLIDWRSAPSSPGAAHRSRSALWTPPIVLVTAAPGESIASVGFARGCEVILGIVIAGPVHVLAEKVSGWARARE